jgi:hypothetical protein
MAVKINASTRDYGPHPKNELALVQVVAEFDEGAEKMTLEVLIPNEGDELALRNRALARARDLARRFIAFPKN